MSPPTASTWQLIAGVGVAHCPPLPGEATPESSGLLNKLNTGFSPNLTRLVIALSIVRLACRGTNTRSVGTLNGDRWLRQLPVEEGIPLIAVRLPRDVRFGRSRIGLQPLLSQLA